ncbi:MAG TPA: PilZ domain-containing protein [Vicinamibacterales bacterium]|nr:PilZ domain-containing protein [Vicinamibacterales bacterium]
MEPPGPAPVPRAPRFPLAMPLRYRSRRTGAWHEATTLNVSRTGLLVRPACGLPPGSPVDLVMALPPCDAFPLARVRCLAAVARQPVEDVAALVIRRYHFLRAGEGDDGDPREAAAAANPG